MLNPLPDTLKAASMRAVLRLLDPLVRLLLEAGVGIGEFHQLAKTAYTRAAQKAISGERPTISRIAVLTGIPRREVAIILKRTEEAPPEPGRGVQRAERVLRGWWKDPHYCDASGTPLKLPLRGARRSFTSLVRRYAGDPRVATVIQELLRVKAVQRLPDGQLEVLRRTFATARWDAVGIEAVGEQIHDFIDTLVYNLQHPHRQRYARFIQSAQIDPRYVPLLIRNITNQLDLMADDFQDNLHDPRRNLRPNHETQSAHRIAVGMFITDEAAQLAARPDSTARKTLPKTR